MHVSVRFVRIVPILFLLLACIAATAFAQGSVEKNPVAMVIRINGALEYRPGAGEEWQPAKANQPLYNRYQVRTDLGNRAIIVYTGSGTRILVNENTELEITAEQPGARGTPERTKLLVGEVYSKIIPKKEAGYKYEVETPSSVASVRGTELNSKYEDGVATYLCMLNVIEVMNQLGSVVLEQYQMSTVATGQAPSEATTLSKGQAQKQTSWTDNVDPIWKLNIIPEGGATQESGAAFSLTIWAENIETDMIDANASFRLSTFSASTDVLEYSTDSGKTWGGIPEILLSNGQAVIWARGTAEGTVTLTAEAPDCEPASVTVTVAEPKEHKTLQLRFTDPDGTNEETLEIELEEK